MYEVHHESGDGYEFHSTVQIEDAAALRKDGRDGPFTVTIGDTDLPAFLSNGVLYLQAPLGLFFEAFAEDLPAFLRDMEIRISDSRGRPFSLNSDGRPVSREGLAEPRVVSNRRWRR
jgi:hypothetical protein